MTDTTNTDPNAQAETQTTAPAAPVKPETWEQEIWDKLEDAEKLVVAGLHFLGVIFSADIWPAIKTSLLTFSSQLGTAIFGVITADIMDPALIPAAIGTTILVTASTQGVVDAKAAVTNAETAIQNDPNVKAALNGQQSG